MNRCLCCSLADGFHPNCEKMNVLMLEPQPSDYHHFEEDLLATDDFGQRRNAKLQRSQDSGTVMTDYSASPPGRRSSHSSSGSSLDEKVAKFVTILAVNGGLTVEKPAPTQVPDSVDEFVTVLPVGSQTGCVCLSSSGFVEEVACVIRRPGHRLGFGLKFDGGVETDVPVQRLFIQCCAESSPAAAIRCSWGRLVEADQIIQIDGEDVSTLTRLQVSFSIHS